VSGPPSRALRRRRHARGLNAETLAAWHLRLRGWRILARRFRCPAGEIDIVARRGGVLAFIEVKARGDLAAALEAVSPRQRRRILRAAEVFVQRSPRHADLVLRFDMMLVRPFRLPYHAIDAWRDSRGTPE
jgi:putative endonuclease